MDFRVSFAAVMKTSDQIIIEELKRIVLMQTQENTLLKARIDVVTVTSPSTAKLSAYEQYVMTTSAPGGISTGIGFEFNL